MIELEINGGFTKTEAWLNRLKTAQFAEILGRYGEEGVTALRSATPKDSGKTASSWSYRVEQRRGSATITWYNSNVNKGVNIAVILQYGHGTRQGGYVRGRDYINPAMRPVFERIADAAFKEVTQA